MGSIRPSGLETRRCFFFIVRIPCVAFLLFSVVCMCIAALGAGTQKFIKKFWNVGFGKAFTIGTTYEASTYPPVQRTVLPPLSLLPLSLSINPPQHEQPPIPSLSLRLKLPIILLIIRPPVLHRISRTQASIFAISITTSVSPTTHHLSNHVLEGKKTHAVPPTP